MTRPNLIVGALAAVCVGMLLWCARLILVADLPLGAHVATWVLWAVAAVAIVTLIAYLREFLTHRQAVGREATWKPLPSLVLLWIGGLTALVSFAFILPDKSSSDGAEGPAKAGTSLTSQSVIQTPATTGASTSAATARGSATTSGAVSRSASRTKVPSSTSTSAGATSTPARPSTSSSTAPATTTTTTPIIDIHNVPTQANPTTPPGR
ncbi:MAG: hypothetical protein ABIO48_09220 [Pedococcus sp.]